MNSKVENYIETPLAAVQQYIDAFNRGDASGMAASFAITGQILDGIAPHVWQEPTAAMDWYSDVLIEGEAHGASGYFVTLSNPLHNYGTNNSAYLVVPDTMAFEVKEDKGDTVRSCFHGSVGENG